MSLSNIEDQTVTIAGTEYFKVKRTGLSRKQLQAVATNNRLKAEYQLRVKQAAKREMNTGIKEIVPEPQYVSATVPMTLVRAVPKEPKGLRKFESWLKRTMGNSADMLMGTDN